MPGVKVAAALHIISRQSFNNAFHIILADELIYILPEAVKGKACDKNNTAVACFFSCCFKPAKWLCFKSGFFKGSISEYGFGVNV